MSKIFLKFLSGLLSGIIGTIIFVLLSFYTQDLMNFSTINSPIKFEGKSFIFIIFFIFITTIIFGLGTNTFYYLIDRKKYSLLKVSILTCLSGSIAIGIIIIPIYLLYGITNLNNLYVVIMLQLNASIILNQLIIESLSESKNILAQSIGIIISSMIGLLLIIMIGKTSILLAIFSTPLLLMSLTGLSSGISDLYPETTIKNPPRNDKNDLEPFTEPETEEIDPNEIDLSHDYSKDSEKF